jgi:hypothetical protein
MLYLILLTAACLQPGDLSIPLAQPAIISQPASQAPAARPLEPSYPNSLGKSTRADK